MKQATPRKLLTMKPRVSEELETGTKLDARNFPEPSKTKKMPTWSCNDGTSVSKNQTSDLGKTTEAGADTNTRINLVKNFLKIRILKI